MSTRKTGFTLAALVATALLGSASMAAAQEAFRGYITLRGDTTFTLMRDDASPVIVQLAETTKIESGYHASDLIIGLKCRVAGAFNDQGRYVAEKITFDHPSYKIAMAINAALKGPEAKLAEHTAELQGHEVTLGEHKATLNTHGETLVNHQTQITDNDLKMVATTGAITTRINNLDEYDAVDTLVVYFKNGRFDIAPDYVDQLTTLAEKAKTVNGYRIQVQGYASAVGPRAFNESLSAERADAVTSLLEQRGGIPPANIFVPAAMGISTQFAENNTAKGQQENRRVIVTVLQSKGLVDR
ncbi:MAG TPA: OmpA family protein [Vicinamibacterales bacterium]|nr:OmpA family protein [Vicinamibacterales bacterium]